MQSDYHIRKGHFSYVYGNFTPFIWTYKGSFVSTFIGGINIHGGSYAVDVFKKIGGIDRQMGLRDFYVEIKDKGVVYIKICTCAKGVRV